MRGITMRKKAGHQKTERQRQIVRLYNTDVDGEKHVLFAMRKIKGVSESFANAILMQTGIDRTKKASDLSDADIERIEKALDNAHASLPSWMLNRRKDYETGNDTHLFLADLTFSVQKDLRRLSKVKSYRGLRHQVGLPVRGQRTRSNFRRNKGKAAAVKRKK